MKQDLKSLILEYVNNPEIRGEAALSGDNRIGNPAAKRLIKARDALRKGGWARELIPLMDSENISVRLWAAADCFDLEPEKAKAVLLEINKRQDSFGFTAQITLQEGLKGKLGKS